MQFGHNKIPESVGETQRKAQFYNVQTVSTSFIDVFANFAHFSSDTPVF